MNFVSDNTGPAAPEIMAAMIAANDGYTMPYGNDPVMDRTTQKLRTLFEAPDASVHLVPTGTAANALALSVMAKPWQTIFCHRESHVAIDECGAPEFYSGGAKLSLIDGEDGRIPPEALTEAITGTAQGDVHSVQRGPVTLTNVTEAGTLYAIDQIKALTEIAKAHDLPVHLDGARFSNACAALGCTPAEMTWKAGVDAVSFGGTKNGCLGVEAVIFFDPAQAWECEIRRKRGGHLFSKHRYLSAQMEAYVTDGLWLRLAGAANAACADLARGLRALPEARLVHEPEGNMIFVALPRALHRQAKAAGALYTLIGADKALDGPDETPLLCRLVCDWSCTSERVEQLLDLFRQGAQ
ncbi:low specificity L-threonine aldolase [Rhodophyticola sp. CCM32]|uniref:threonine aldolase family protein n=1 Tax=Rhodophyticola sp. CCM32 TaxID=2916397 RepID=UPI00107F4234|nr:low specificity L-threonine aldolase [Rhodophyticola sp. CCM32]QBX99689.1 low specificity L-threonine aldolase [Rhodophyticola sp. CCM32]